MPAPRLLLFCLLALLCSASASLAADDPPPVGDGSDTETLYIVIYDNEIDNRLFERCTEAIRRAFERFNWPTPLQFEHGSFEGPPDSVEIEIHLRGFSEKIPRELRFSGWLVVDYDGGDLDLGMQIARIDIKFGEHLRAAEDRVLDEFGRVIVQALDEAGLAGN